MSQAVVGLAALIASAWRVHSSAAASGTSTRAMSQSAPFAVGQSVDSSADTPSAGSTQNTAVVGFTSIPTSPAARAKPPTAGRLFSRHAIVAHAKPTAPAVARYSIIDVRLQRTANGVETKATSAASPLAFPSTWRTRP